MLTTIEIDSYGNATRVERTALAGITFESSPITLKAHPYTLGGKTTISISGSRRYLVTELSHLTISTGYRVIPSTENPDTVLLTPDFNVGKETALPLTLEWAPIPGYTLCLLSMGGFSYSPSSNTSYLVYLRLPDGDSAKPTPGRVLPLANVWSDTGKLCPDRELFNSAPPPDAFTDALLRHHGLVYKSLIGDIPNLWQTDLLPNLDTTYKMFRWVAVKEKPPKMGSPFSSPYYTPVFSKQLELWVTLLPYSVDIHNKLDVVQGSIIDIANSHLREVR